MKKLKKIHFIGIGGIGVSAIARMMILDGKKVSGSDGSESEIIDEIKKMGAKVVIGHSADNFKKGVELVIYTIAITPDNPELLKAKEMGIPTISYPESLSLISEGKFTIAISGTHGKTTTTAMIGKMMMDAGLDPTVIVGSFMRVPSEKNKRKPEALFSDWERSNFIGGKGGHLVVEACEYRRSFLNIIPKIVVITNIDDDHLDYYKDIKDIGKAFSEFVAKLPKDGFVICDLKNKSVKKAVKNAPCTVIDYSRIDDRGLKLKVPGKHNIENAKAVLAVAEILEIDKALAMRSLSEYPGVWRRFEYKGRAKNGALVYDDYGHHPTEIKATLKAARELFPNSKINVVFQPHLYSRTKLLLPKFAKAFGDADRVYLAPIYAAREPTDPTISSKILGEELRKNKIKAEWFDFFEEIIRILNKDLKSGEVIITIGAGDVYKIAQTIVSQR